MFLTDVPFTVQTATILAFDGFKTLENLAIANRMSWSILTDEMVCNSFFLSFFLSFVLVWI